MKRVILMIGALMAFVYTSQAQKKINPAFSLTVDVSHLPSKPQKIYLVYYKKTTDGIAATTDSVLVKGERARFTGLIEEPSLALLQTKMFGEVIKFCLSPEMIRVSVGETWDTFTVKGSEIQSDFEILGKEQALYDAKAQNIAELCNKAYDQKDTVKAQQYRADFLKVGREMYTWVYKPYIISHAKTSALSAYALNLYAHSGLSATDSLYNLLAPPFKQLPSMVILKKELDKKSNTSVGQPAPLFTQPDTLGKKIDLASFKGKYVLLEFWASWCHPCRAESSYLIKAYDKFHTKNFEILSVSLDEQKNKDSWLKAIHDDHVGAWTQVSDLKGWKNEVSTLYGINSIPQNYLLDPQGKIIATNLRGEELEKKLGELLGKM